MPPYGSLKDAAGLFCGQFYTENRQSFSVLMRRFYGIGFGVIRTSLFDYSHETLVYGYQSAIEFLAG